MGQQKSRGAISIIINVVIGFIAIALLFAIVTQLWGGDFFGFVFGMFSKIGDFFLSFDWIRDIFSR